MQIDHDNYESYFLDFLEGRLSEQEIDHLLTFLKNNPDLEDRLLSIDKYVVESNSAITLNKNFLFKSLDNFHSVNEHNFDEFCVAYFEKDLSHAASGDLLDYLKSNPGKLKDFENCRKAFLNPPWNVKYPFKSKLKKFSLLPIRKLVYFSFAAASILLLVFYLIPLNQKYSASIKPTSVLNDRISNTQTQNSVNSSELVSKINKPVSEKRNPVILIGLNTKPAYALAENKNEILPERSDNLTSMHSIEINDLKLPITFDKIAFIPAQDKKLTKSANPVYQSIREFALNKLRRNSEKNSNDNRNDSDLTLWDLATLGANGINKLTGSSIKLDRKLNNNGDMVTMAIESGKLGFSRSLSK